MLPEDLLDYGCAKCFGGEIDFARQTMAIQRIEKCIKRKLEEAMNFTLRMQQGECERASKSSAAENLEMKRASEAATLQQKRAADEAELEWQKWLENASVFKRRIYWCGGAAGILFIGLGSSLMLWGMAAGFGMASSNQVELSPFGGFVTIAVFGAGFLAAGILLKWLSKKMTQDDARKNPK